jgi:membrane protease YdiL (CAAX protease family)
MTNDGAVDLKTAMLALLVSLGIQLVIGAGFPLLLPSPVDHREIWVLALNALSIVGISAAIGFSVSRGLHLGPLFGVSARVGTWTIVAIVSSSVLSYAAYFVHSSLGWVASGGSPISPRLGVISVVSEVVVIPILEETLFRGIVLHSLLLRYQPIRAVILSSLLFSLFHPSLPSATSAFVIGLASGLFLVQARSLWPCIAGHWVWNAVISVIENAHRTSDALGVL